MARPERLIPRCARHPFGAHYVRPESLRDSVELPTGLSKLRANRPDTLEDNTVRSWVGCS